MAAFDWTTFLGTNLGAMVKDIVGAFKVDPTIALQVNEKLAEAQLNLQAKLIDQVNAQVEVNVAEAQSKNTFIAGWRPFIGWVCGAAFGYQFVVAPFVTFLANITGHSSVVMPKFDMSDMMPVLLGMLGLGGLRTYEKVNGVGTANQ